MFNFNKSSEQVKENEEGPTFRNKGFEGDMNKHLVDSSVSAEIDNMYSIFIKGDEMGIVKKEEAQEAKDIFDNIRNKFPEEVNALYGKTHEEQVRVLNNLLAKMN
jgi:hypothetical protein